VIDDIAGLASPAIEWSYIGSLCQAGWERFSMDIFGSWCRLSVEIGVRELNIE